MIKKLALAVSCLALVASFAVGQVPGFSPDFSPTPSFSPGFSPTPGFSPNPPNRNQISFDMVRSPALRPFFRFVPNARAEVTINSEGPVEVLDITISGLPPNTDFDFFVIQVPNAPFGLSWYQGDIETNRSGSGHETFVGRFSIETFIVAPGVAQAPLTFRGPFPSVAFNPQTEPVQLYHLGLWFNDPRDARRAGGPDTVTPFNGEHNAGVQVLNTSNFPDQRGPLIGIHS